MHRAQPPDATLISGALFEHDIQRAANALAIDVTGGAAQNFDLFHHFGRDAIHRNGAVILLTRQLAPVDQHLRVLGVQPAQPRQVILTDIAGKADTRHTLKHVANRNRLEALEKRRVVNQFGGWAVHVVALNNTVGKDVNAFHWLRRVIGINARSGDRKRRQNQTKGGGFHFGSWFHPCDPSTR